MKSHPFPVQLELPPDCCGSAPCVQPQSPATSKRPRSRLLQARLEANLAMLGRLDTVPGSFSENSDVGYFRQGQRFSLISSFSMIINEVNGNHWPGDCVAALPHIGKGKDAKFSDRRPFVGRGSLPNLQAGPLQLLTANQFGRAALALPSTSTPPASCSSARPVPISSQSLPAPSSPAASCRSATICWPSRSS